MSSNPGNTPARKVPAGVFVLLLFGAVALMFAVFYLPTKRIKDNEAAQTAPANQATADAFMERMQSGKNLLDQGVGGAEKAAENFQKAVELHPGDLDARLNLANALLLLNRSEEVMAQTAEALKLNSNSAAAHYLNGCAHVRLGQFEQAVQSLQIAKQIDHTINAVSYQLGRAYQGMGDWEQASLQFEEVVQFDPEHPSAYYNLSQTYIRMQRQEDAGRMMEKHQEVVANNPLSADPSVTEQCIYTEAIAPFQLEQPDVEGIAVQFKDATTEMLGEQASNLLGPVGVLDIGHDDQLDLLVREKDQGFKLLVQQQGVFQPAGFPVPLLPDATYYQCLIGDLQHQGSMRTGQQEDAVLLSDKGVQVFQVSPNGMLSDSSMFSRLAPLQAAKARLTDFDVTGKLDLIAIGATNRSLLFHRNQGTFSFNLETSHTNLPSGLTGVSDFMLADWDGDDLADLLVTFEDQPSQLYLKQRGAPMKLAESSKDWPLASNLAVGDLNNDLLTDVVFLTSESIQVRLQGDDAAVSIPIEAGAKAVQLLDYDNDGWLDMCVFGGNTFRAWRNRGLEGFVETTDAIGLNQLNLGDIQSLSKGDFDGDCDSDLLVTLSDQSFRLLRNEGGNANTMMKIRMEGSRSNPSGLGVKVELTAGGLRLSRTLHELPFEIGLGKRTKVDSIDPHWSDTITQVDYEIDSCSSLVLFELEMPTGSCPYLYAWDGERYRFVTDLLGAAPLGLPVAENVYIPADTDEWVWLGDDSMFPAKDGDHVVQLTEELREVLYLDEAKLAAVDHPPGTEVHTTGKLVPGPPFPRHELRTFGHARSLQSAIRNDGEILTQALHKNDQHMASPVALQAPQLRGWAEPYFIDLDFGNIDGDQPWALLLTGWLHFGGGMANIGASHRPDLPFPFPTLQIQDTSGEWKPLDVTVGAPAGKTKTIVVDLAGKLPSGKLKLRLSMAFEIHWDRIQLMQAVGEEHTHLHVLSPTETDLHWRGFSAYEERVWGKPLTPDYAQADFAPSWLITPAGWCTRYGDVSPLIESKDNALALLNGGDELTLKFAADRIPGKRAGQQRDFFFFSSGWDKDADFHVARGWTVEPMPWHGMDDQQYGKESYPAHLDTEWMETYNTRWVGEMTLRQKRNSRQ